MENYFEVKFRLWNEQKLDPDWIEKIPFYEYQFWVMRVNQSIEEQIKKKKERGGMKEAFSFTKY